MSERESFWIEEYKSYKYGYNATLGGDGKFLFNHQDIKDALINHPYPIDIAKQFGCSKDLVYMIAKQHNVKCENKGRNNVEKEKVILQLTNDENFIQEFISVSKAAQWCFENNYCKTLNSGVRSHIADCANGKRKSAYGFKWTYKDQI